MAVAAPLPSSEDGNFISRSLLSCRGSDSLQALKIAMKVEDIDLES